LHLFNNVGEFKYVPRYEVDNGKLAQRTRRPFTRSAFGREGKIDGSLI
jgi:hypothetical protein